MINPENQPKKIFTIGVVADYFRCHQRTVLRWITEGKLDAYQQNGEYRKHYNNRAEITAKSDLWFTVSR